jgi:YbgC/YbaW family acyl-CoA thioester hydrolase
MEFPRVSVNYTVPVWHMDIFRHVHWTRYLNYVDKGRKALQREMGIPNRGLKKSGCGLFLKGVSDMKYNIQIRNREPIQIASSLDSFNGTRIGMYHEITNKRGDLAARCKTSHVFVDLKTGKPVRIRGDHVPEEVAKFIGELDAYREAGIINL